MNFVQIQQIANGFIVSTPSQPGSGPGAMARTQTFCVDLTAVQAALVAYFTPAS
jgi:hypothetical protein